MIDLKEKELKQLRSLKTEIELLAKEIMNIKPEQVVDSAKDYRSGYPHNIIIRGYSNEKMNMLRGKLQYKQVRLQDKLYDLEEWLDGIEDSEMRTILRLYYRNGMTQNEIGKELGYTRSAIAMKIERFLNKI